MKKNLLILFFCCLLIFQSKAQTQKLIGDCTISYAVISGNSGSMSKTFKTVYIRNNQSRTDLKSSNFIQSVIYDDEIGNAVVLRELNGEKYMSALDAGSWKQQNLKYENLIFANTNESKIILGYNCIKAKEILKDGSVFYIFYYPAFLPSCTENPWQFKNIPGMIMEYETQGENNIMTTFTATAIDFNPVPHYKFEIPKSGYRILN